MSILHLDLRLLTDTAAELRYFFDNPNDYERRELLLSDIAELISDADVNHYVRLPKPAREIGQELYRWLNRDGILTQHLNERPLAVAIATEQRFSYLPWEVLHDGQLFLVQRGMIPIRWTGERPLELFEKPQNRVMNLLFMATSPENVKPISDYEFEEARILQATKNQPLNLVVEESGCLDELRQLVADQEDSFDVFHLTGHATLQKGQPRFVTETQEGDAHLASAEEIARSLANRVPPLVFLSGCHTGQAGDAGEVRSMAEALLRSGASAVLGWGNSVRDTEATAAAEVLYQTLAEGGTVLEALSLTYQKLLEQGARDWHLLRLYAAHQLPTALVTRRNTVGRKRAAIASTRSQFLNPDESDPRKRIKVPTREEFVGRRRQIQRCLRSLSTTQTERLGVLIHGMGGLGKSSVAARLCDRVVERIPIVWVGRMDGASLCHRLRDKLSLELRQTLLNPHDELRYRLRDVFDGWDGRPFVFVLDDFEHNLEATATGYELSADVSAMLEALMWAIAETNAPHRVMITCRYDVESSWLESFYRQPMEAMHGADLEKKCDRLRLSDRGTVELQDEAKQRSGGNPLVLERLSEQLTEESPDLAATVEGLKPRVLADSLVQQLEQRENRSLREMLSRGAVFEIPVPQGAMALVCGATEFERSLEQSIALGLMEVSPNGEVRVPRILSLAVPPIAEAVYKQMAEFLYRQWCEEAETSTEEQKLEIHRLAMIGKGEELAGKLADVLANQWVRKSHYRETVALCRETMAISDNPRFLHTFAIAEKELGNPETALELHQNVLETCSAEDEELKAATLHQMAIIYAKQGRVIDALRLYQESLALSEKSGNVQGKAAALYGVAILCANHGELIDAIALYQESSALSEESGNVQGKAAALQGIAILCANQGKVNSAISLLQKSLVLTEQIEDVQTKAYTLSWLGGLAQQQGEFETALRYLQESIAILNHIGSPDVATVENIFNSVKKLMLQSTEGQQQLQSLFNLDPATLQDWIAQAQNQE